MIQSGRREHLSIPAYHGGDVLRIGRDRGRRFVPLSSNAWVTRARWACWLVVCCTAVPAEEPDWREALAKDFKIPYLPVSKDHTEVIAAIAGASFDDYFKGTVAFWSGILDSVMKIDVPEKKVVDTMRASIVYDLIARDVSADGKRFVQKVNEFQYDHFYPRDTAYIVRAYDLLGLHDIARETIEHFLTYGEHGKPTGLKRLMNDVLHLASALSPEWLQPGESIRVQGAPTLFGKVSYRIDVRDDAAVVEIDPEWRKPAEMVFHVPWFLEVLEVRVDGRQRETVDGAIRLRPEDRRILLRWRWKERPQLSYEAAVQHFLERYHRRSPDADYSFLFPTPRPPQVRYGHSMFIDSLDCELFVPGGAGTIYYTLDGTPASRRSPRCAEPISLTATTTINAFTVWDNGRTSAPLQVTLSRVTPKEAVKSGDFAPGLRVEYYEGSWDVLPDFDQLQPVRRGEAHSFDVDVIAHRENDFALRFTGFLEVPRDGVYTFHVASDDGSRLYVDAELLLDNDGLYAVKEESGSIALAAGKHAMMVTFFERGGAQRLQVNYAGPQGVRGPIPAGMLFHSD